MFDIEELDHGIWSDDDRPLMKLKQAASDIPTLGLGLGLQQGLLYVRRLASQTVTCIERTGETVV